MSSRGQEVLERQKKSIEDGVHEWLQRPEVKLMLSMLPKAENEDLVKVLLTSCFSAGYAKGTGEIMVELMQGLLKKDKPNAP